jgi:pseudaminic acid synthase
MRKQISDMHIAGRRIAEDAEPYVIAELSANHNGKLDTALRIVEAAKAAGADAVKLQTYRPDTITLNSQDEPFMVRGGLWDGRSLYDLYQEAHTPWEWHEPIFAHGKKLGITVFSSPFDSTAVDLLEGLEAPAYKIASFEAIDLPLIRYVASKKKPMIISTGMASEQEIQDAIDAAHIGGCKELAILRCVSGYPAPAGEYNLRTLTDMRARFGVLVGLSDHTLDNTTAVASVAMGACIVEKHFTLDRSGGGPDDSFSLEPPELTELCRSAKTAWHAMGRVDYGIKPSESGNIKFRRSLYFVKPLVAGSVITADAVRSVRPGYGLPPKELDSVIGKRVTADVGYGTAVTRALVTG